MKVLHVLNELNPSGAEVMLRVAAPHFRKLGVKCDILAKGRTPGPYAPILGKAGYTIHHLPFSRSLLSAARFFGAYYRFLRSHGYHVVHIHTEEANMWLGVIARLAGVSRIVRTIHNNFRFRGFLRLRRAVQRAALRALAAVHVSIGNSVAATEREYFRNPTVLISNWYDEDRFVPPGSEERNRARTSLGIEDGTFVAVSVGNCSPVKNHTAILRALAQISERLDFLYLHVGKEEPGEPERRLAEELGIDGRARFLGFVEDVVPLLHASDAFVMPSLWEGFSISVLEVLATGLPAILADVPGLRDLKKVLNSIHWVEPSPEPIAKAILARASLAGGASSDIRIRSHKAISEPFGARSGVRAYCGLYAGLLKPEPQ